MTSEAIEPRHLVASDGGVSLLDRWAGGGLTCLAKCAGQAAGSSVRAMRQTGSTLAGLPYKVVAAARRPRKDLEGGAAAVPSVHRPPEKVSWRVRLRARARIRRLQKEMAKARKSMGSTLAAGVVAGQADPSADTKVVENLAVIRARQVEIDDLRKALSLPETETPPPPPALFRIRPTDIPPSDLARAGPPPARVPRVEIAAAAAEPAPTARAPAAAERSTAEVAGIRARAQAPPSPPEVPPTPLPTVLQTRVAAVAREVASPEIRPAAQAPQAGPARHIAADDLPGETRFRFVSEQLAFENAVRDAQSADAQLRQVAVAALARIGAPAARQALMALTKDPVDTIRARSLEALLARSGDDGALIALAGAMVETDPSAKVRVAALRGLYRTEGVAAVPVLVKALADASAMVRRRAATCLTWTGARAAIPDLMLLLEDPDPEVRRAAIEGLEQLRGKFAVGRLIEILGDEDPRVRQGTAGALQSLTGQNIPFNARGSRDARARATVKWREWWAANQATFSR